MVALVKTVSIAWSLVKDRYLTRLSGRLRPWIWIDFIYDMKSYCTPCTSQLSWFQSRFIVSRDTDHNLWLPPITTISKRSIYLALASISLRYWDLLRSRVQYKLARVLPHVRIPIVLCGFRHGVIPRCVSLSIRCSVYIFGNRYSYSGSIVILGRHEIGVYASSTTMPT